MKRNREGKEKSGKKREEEGRGGAASTMPLCRLTAARSRNVRRASETEGGG